MADTHRERDDSRRDPLVSLSYDHLVGFGEAMVRLSAPVGQTLAGATCLATDVGGAELNGLISATAFGMRSKWVSAVGDDAAGHRIIRHVNSYGVIPALKVSGARSGLYFVEMAAFPRSTQVFYDRSGSAASLLDHGAIDWTALVNGRSCFYSSGITAAISNAARRALEEAIQHSKKVGAVVAFDTNYRGEMWPADQAYEWMSSVMPNIDILSLSDADIVQFGLDPKDLGSTREALGVGVLLVSSKRRTAEAIKVSVCVIDDDGRSEVHGEAVVVDPLGAGDAMFGAFLATAPTSSRQVAVENALKASLITYGIHGDAMDVDPSVALDGGRILR